VNRLLLIILITLLLPLTLSAQLIKSKKSEEVSAKYLSGAVPEIDGKIIFTKTIVPVKNISDDDLFSVVYSWVNANYNNDHNPENKIILYDREKKDIACSGEEEIVFAKNLAYVDMTFLLYNLVLEVENGECKMTVRNIKFTDGYDKHETFPAKDMIIDKIAVKKNGKELNRYFDKYRVNTIDFVDKLYDSLNNFVNEGENK